MIIGITERKSQLGEIGIQAFGLPNISPIQIQMKNASIFIKNLLTATAGFCLISTTAIGTPQYQGEKVNLQQSAKAESTYIVTPQRRALLNTIRYAEGTWKQGVRGYHMLYGGGHVESLAAHPNIMIHRRYSSAAAGAYQFLPTTWREAARKLQLPTFNADCQDQAALYLIDRRGVLESVDRKGLSRDAMAVLAHEWASLPGHDGESAYGQPARKADELLNFYAANLRQLTPTT